MRRNSILLTLSLASCLVFSCSDVSEQQKWGFHEEEAPVEKILPPIKSGVYRVELKVHEDTCEPSLATLVETYSDWPPRNIQVMVYPKVDDHKPMVDIWFYEPRTGEGQSFWAYLKDDNSPRSIQLFDYIWPDEDIIRNPECWDPPLYWNHFHTELSARAASDGVIDLDVRSLWYGPKECEREPPRRSLLESLPQSPCEESYTFTYVLEEACERVQVCDDKFPKTGDNEKPGLHYTRYDMCCMD